MSDETREAMLLRLPPALKEQVRERAVASKRSLTRQIEFELEHYPAPEPDAHVGSSSSI